MSANNPWFGVFQPGDVVRIRSYEDMEAEYDFNDYGIRCPDEISFAKDMKYLCGREYTIEQIDLHEFRNRCEVVRFEDAEADPGRSVDNWIITTCMIELAARPVITEVSIDDFAKVLSGGESFA